LPVWVVQTGEVPQLAVGDVWERMAVRGSWSNMGPATDADGLIDLPVGVEESPQQLITGVVTVTREPHTVIVRAGSCELLMEPKAIGPAVDPGPEDQPADQIFPDVVLPEPGARFSFVATCSVMLDYEVSAYDYADLRRDWRVRGLRVEHREFVPSPGPGGGNEPGRILRVDTIDRMLRWGDASRRELAVYLVDVEPV
jgi:hypothetical protein